jgi:hypothetical protein
MAVVMDVVGQRHALILVEKDAVPGQLHRIGIVCDNG